MFFPGLNEFRREGDEEPQGHAQHHVYITYTLRWAPRAVHCPWRDLCLPSASTSPRTRHWHSLHNYPLGFGHYYRGPDPGTGHDLQFTGHKSLVESGSGKQQVRNKERRQAPAYARTSTACRTETAAACVHLPVHAASTADYCRSFRCLLRALCTASSIGACLLVGVLRPPRFEANWPPEVGWCAPLR